MVTSSFIAEQSADAHRRELLHNADHNRLTARSRFTRSEGVVTIPIAPSRSSRPRLVGINHVALEVTDLDAALAFYGTIFELREIEREPGMAFIEMGDQFIALTQGPGQPPDRARHFGLVVDDKPAARAALEARGVEILPGGRLDFRDPWGNHVQVVDYRDIQFTKAPPVLRGMGLEPLSKRRDAIRQLRTKGLT